MHVDSTMRTPLAASRVCIARFGLVDRPSRHRGGVRTYLIVRQDGCLLARRREDDGRYVRRLVNCHYFNIGPELMQELVLGWKRPETFVGRRRSAREPRFARGVFWFSG